MELPCSRHTVGVRVQVSSVSLYTVAAYTGCTPGNCDVFNLAGNYREQTLHKIQFLATALLAQVSFDRAISSGMLWSEVCFAGAYLFMGVGIAHLEDLCPSPRFSQTLILIDRELNCPSAPLSTSQQKKKLHSPLNNIDKLADHPCLL